MILKAYFSDPAKDAYIDSLGWVRYKQGWFADKLEAEKNADPNEDEVTLGAVTLLKQAATTRAGRENPVILDHFGDSLWRSGKPEEAVAAWDQAVSAYQQLKELTSSMEPTQLEIVEATYGPVIDLVKEKLKTVESGAEPPTAPLGEGVDESDP